MLVSLQLILRFESTPDSNKLVLMFESDALSQPLLGAAHLMPS